MSKLWYELFIYEADVKILFIITVKFSGTDLLFVHTYQKNYQSTKLLMHIYRCTKIFFKIPKINHYYIHHWSCVLNRTGIIITKCIFIKCSNFYNTNFFFQRMKYDSKLADLMVWICASMQKINWFLLIIIRY